MGGIQGFADRIQNAALGGNGLALDAGPGGGWMAASAELAGDGIDVDLRTFGTETDPGQAGLDFLKEARDDHALDGPDMIDEPLGIVRQRAGAQVIAFLQPEISGA